MKKNQIYKVGLALTLFTLISYTNVSAQLIKVKGAPYTNTVTGSTSQPNQVLNLVQDHIGYGTFFGYTPTLIPHIRFQTVVKGRSQFPNITTNTHTWDMQVSTNGALQYKGGNSTIQILDEVSGSLLHQWSEGNYQAHGSIHATEVTVTDPANFPDYVFEDSYNLMPLEEVETFIKENKHLPNIPTAKVVAEEGLKIGDLQVRQMEKIEELFLYVIQIQSNMKTLELENKRLNEEIRTLKK